LTFGCSHIGGGRNNKFPENILHHETGSMSDYQTFVKFVKLKSPLNYSSNGGRLNFSENKKSANDENQLSNSATSLKMKSAFFHYVSFKFFCAVIFSCVSVCMRWSSVNSNWIRILWGICAGRIKILTSKTFWGLIIREHRKP